MTDENKPICRLYALINCYTHLHYAGTTVWLPLKGGLIIQTAEPAVYSLNFWTAYKIKFLNVPSNFMILKSSITIIDVYSVRVENSRMAAPGGAFSAALRRSQDLDIGEQKHRHADRSARSLQAHRFFSSLHQHPTSWSIWKTSSLRAAAPQSLSFIFSNGNFSGALFLDVKPSLCLEKAHFYVELNSPVKLQAVMFWCVKEGRMEKWANATGRNCTKDVNIALPPTRNRLYYLQEGGSSYK